MVNLCASGGLAKSGAVVGRAEVVWVSLGKSDPTRAQKRSLRSQETSAQEVAAGVTKFSSVHL